MIQRSYKTAQVAIIGTEQNQTKKNWKDRHCDLFIFLIPSMYISKMKVGADFEPR